MEAVLDTVRAALAAAGTTAASRYCLALSGGLDSSVLLHAMAQLAPGMLRAIHVDHQLQPASAAWAEHCERLCRRLAVPLLVCRVNVSTIGDEGLEAAARRARYGALGAALAAGELLLTAHQRDDQVETLLLHLLRGTGVAGLGGIPRLAAFRDGRLLRPLLDLPRAVLLDYAKRVGLEWVEDPSNRDARIHRNFLRHEVLALLRTRWPGLDAAVARSARLSAEAARLLDELAAQDARRVRRAGRIAVTALQQFDEARQRNVLRWLCRREIGSAPGEQQLREGVAQLLGAGADRNPVLAWPGGELRRYRGQIYLQRPLPDQLPLPREMPARAGAILDLGTGRLRLARTRGRGLSLARLGGRVFTVRLRAGGERLRPAGEPHHRELKKLLQEQGIVPWMRGRIPLLFCGDQLVAVAHLWVAAEFAATGAEPALRVCWDERPLLT